jgi:hypothetical protein
MANPHELGLSKGRFWSSGDELPVIRIIARVLADPTEKDLEILKNRFGIDAMLQVWGQLRDRGEVADSVVPITEKMLAKLSDDLSI